MFNKKNNKIITFRESNLAAKHLIDYPKPATNSVPQWFKKQKLFSSNTNDELSGIKDGAVGTYKRCVPITDSITAGYNILLPATIYVINTGDKKTYTPFINWQVSWDICDTQPLGALGNYPIPTGHNNTFFRWSLNWEIQTPKEYSLWITHPSHRYDLPFTTLNGFVDTDLHPNRLLLPFFIKENFEGIIEAGTPIAQIIPIKRDFWQSEKKPLKENSDFITNNNVKIFFSKTYKKLYWSKKRYL